MSRRRLNLSPAGGIVLPDTRHPGLSLSVAGDARVVSSFSFGGSKWQRFHPSNFATAIPFRNWD